MKHFVKMASFDAKLLFILHFICYTLSAPQQPEISDQFITTTAADETKRIVEETPSAKSNVPNATINTKIDEHETEKEAKSEGTRRHFNPQTEIIDADLKPTFLETIYSILTKPISRFLSTPKVSLVLRNVGTCIVNGAMEIITHYFPAPIIPLIASAAGMVIPFEPVIMLKEKMPVTSYRRAFNKALYSFLNTFSAYKLDSFDDDPYMTRRFNRRFSNDISEEKKKKNYNMD